MQIDLIADTYADPDLATRCRALSIALIEVIPEPWAAWADEVEKAREAFREHLAHATNSGLTATNGGRSR